MHLLDQGAIDGTVREVEIDARGQRQARGVGLVGRHVVDVHQHLESVAIGGDITAEAPLLAQHAVEQPVVDVRRDAVDFVVGGHDAARVALLDGGLERHQEVLADHAFGIIAGRGVGAALRLAVHGEVLGGGHHVMMIDIELVALQAENGGDAHARDQVRIFAVGLFGAAPARIAGDAEHRSEHLGDAGGAGLIAGGGEDVAHQRRIPGAGQCQRLRKAGAAVAHETVQRFAHEQPRECPAESSRADSAAPHCG